MSRQAVLTIVFLASLAVPAGSQPIVNRFATPVAARGVRAASDMRVDTSASGGVTRRDNHTLAGAAIGLVAGGAIGYGLGAFIDTNGARVPDPEHYGRTIGPLVFGTLGLVVGAIIGHLVPAA